MKRVLYLSLIVNALFLVAACFLSYETLAKGWGSRRPVFSRLSSPNPGVTTAGKVYRTKRSIFYSMQRPANKHKIIFLGDSITQNNNWDEMFGSPAILNRGISGDTTRGILHRIGNIVYLQPRKLFVMAGINDFTRGRTVRQVMNDYRRIIEAVRRGSPATDIYVQSTLPINNELNGSQTDPSKIILLNKHLKAYCRSRRLTFINLYPLFADSTQHLKVEYTFDGTHPNGKAYLLWESKIRPYITK